ncbi:hypothetical protein KTQ54_06325 [Komagataeibacter oboediens]|uniref:hypothetical protein n=1 Tax=Komagataeibacter oboediens TaxID=65958 RepID=UPI001C2C4655|nr:hypothetical protein [Komagataeibacter oboediens]MBV0888153.1 hypothetical protein [Komagataeibacter oboediens]MCK9820745.1 hypothetical protein [Komagataeibacter oboediens]
MTSQSKDTNQSIIPKVSAKLSERVLAEFGIARFRDQVFDAVFTLWKKRQDEGWTQKQLADAIGRDKSWISKNLRAPGNWTLATAGELISALEGDAEITIYAIDDDDTELEWAEDAYAGYIESEGESRVEGIAEEIETYILISQRNFTIIDHSTIINRIDHFLPINDEDEKPCREMNAILTL